MSEIPAGWYPDPTVPPSPAPVLRYWDGDRWTEHVSWPTAASVPSGPPEPTTPDGATLARWWHRVGAYLIDVVLGSIIATIATLPAQISIQHELPRLSDEFERRLEAGDSDATNWYFGQVFDLYLGHAIEFLIAPFVLLIVQAVFLRLWGGKPGQLLTGLRVRLRERPGNLSWGRAIARVLLGPGISSIVMLLGFLSGSWPAIALTYLIATAWTLIDPLWAAWDSKRQTLHDKLVGTNVVRKG